MKRATATLGLLSLILLMGSLVAVGAQEGGGLNLDWWTVDGGGGAVSGGGYTLEGTAGQPEAAQVVVGGYSLAGGFWSGGGAARFDVYLPVVLRDFH